MKTKRLISMVMLNVLLGFSGGSVWGQYNLQLGTGALPYNSGYYNTALGIYALYGNYGGAYGGSYNTAVGYGGLAGNTAGHYNTAVGVSALATNGVGNSNVAVGLQALLNSKGSGTLRSGRRRGSC